MKILVMGGTRFVGKSLVGKLLSKNYDIDIFTRGNKSNPEKTNLIKGDRNNSEDIVKLRNKKYDVVFDISGRELEQTKLLIENLDNSFQRYIYVSSEVFIKIIVNYPYPKLIQLIQKVGIKESLRQKIG
jgi:nucleoside-diphosphate-sugar epimerase